MVVTFTKEFVKELQRKMNKSEAKKLVLLLMKTEPTDGKFIALVKNIVIKERKEHSFRFYFVQQQSNIQIMTEEEIKQKIIKFVALSKKNNQQKVIDVLKLDLLTNGFSL